MDNIQQGEDLQDYHNRVATTTPVGFGNAVDINSTGVPLDNENNRTIMDEAEPEKTTDEYVAEIKDYKAQVNEQLSAKYDEVGVETYSHAMDVMKQQALESGDPDAIFFVDELTDSARGIGRGKLRAAYKAGKAKAKADGTLGDYNQKYRDNIRRLSGVMPASEVADETIRQLGGWAPELLIAGSKWGYNNLFDFIDGGHRAEDKDISNRIKVKQREQLNKIQPTNIDLTVGAAGLLMGDETYNVLGFNFDKDSFTLPIVFDGVFIGSSVGIGGVNKGAQLGGSLVKGLAKAFGVSEKVIAKATPTALMKMADKVSTSGNLSKLGISANAIGGAAFSIEAGNTDTKSILLGAAMGAGLPTTIEGGGKVLGKTGHVIGRSRKTALLEKTEKISGAKPEELNNKYKAYLKDTKPIANEDIVAAAEKISGDDEVLKYKQAKKKLEEQQLGNMSSEDKLAVLRKNYDSVTDVVRASEGSTAEAQNAVQKKTKEHFSAVTSKLFDIDKVDGTGSAAIKDAISKQVQDLKTSMVAAIKTAKQALNDYHKEFTDNYRNTKLDEPISMDDILTEHIDSMPDDIFDDLTSMGIDKPELLTVADLKEVHEVIKGKGIVDVNGNLLDDLLGTTIEEHLEPSSVEKYMQITDLQKLHDWLDDVKGISYMFKHDVTDVQIANKIRKIMATDSYAPITKVLEPDQIAKIERVALSSLFLKDGILTEGGRVNFWSLYRDARSIHAVSKDMVAIKDLMRVYANHVGTSRLTAKAVADYETGGKGRDNVASEFASRGIGQVIAMIHQFFPSEAGRSTYIHRHAMKMIQGESVPKVDNLADSRINALLARTLAENNVMLARQGISKATTNKEIADLNAIDANSDITSLGRAPYKTQQHNDNTAALMTVRKTNNGEASLSWFGQDLQVMKLNSKVDKNYVDGTNVVDVINSDTLHNNYPELSKYAVYRGDNTYVNNSSKMIVIDKNADDFVGSLLHEVQHATNFLDDALFYGSDPTKYLSPIHSIFPELEKYGDLLADPDTTSLLGAAIHEKLYPNTKWSDLVPMEQEAVINLLPFSQYLKNPGERLSRMVDSNVITQANSTELLHAYEKTANDYTKFLIEEIGMHQPGENTGSINAMYWLENKLQGLKNKNSNKGIAKVDYNPDYNSRQFDPTNQALKKLIDDGKDFAMTPAAIKKYLRGHGITNAHMKDVGVNSILGDGKQKPSDLLERLKTNGLFIDKQVAANKENSFVFYDSVDKPKLYNSDAETKVWPDAIDKNTLSRTNYKEIVIKDIRETNMKSRHYSDVDDYKSHIIIQNANLINREKTTHILEVQNDLDSKSHIDDLNAFIRDGIDVAIEEAKKVNSKTISWPEAEVVGSRYHAGFDDYIKQDANNKKLYTRIYDKQMPKMARKYARAHNLKMPYKVDDVWVLDLESTVDRSKQPSNRKDNGNKYIDDPTLNNRLAKEAKNKARLDNLW